MDRRRFLVTSLAGAFTAPLAAGAQQPGKLRRIGSVCPARDPRITGAFEVRLREFGYVVGRDITLDYRCTDGTSEQLHAAARELVLLPVDVLVAWGTASASAAKTATSTIPVVFFSVPDPVAVGFVASLARPGGNMTGMTFDAGSETPGKRLQILKEAVPSLSRVAVLHAQTDPNVAPQLESINRAARTLGVHIEVVAFERLEELETAFSRVRMQRAQGLVVLPGNLTWSTRTKIAELALSNRLPSSHGFQQTVAVGGLMSLGVNYVDMARRTADYVDKILKGAKPADLPVEQPTTFELVINLKSSAT